MSRTDNPYSSPQTPSETETHSPSTKQTESALGVVLLLVATVIGGFLGNASGNIVAYGLGYILRPLRRGDLLEIAHPLGLVFLVVGAFVGAWLSTWFDKRR